MEIPYSLALSDSLDILEEQPSLVLVELSKIINRLVALSGLL